MWFGGFTIWLILGFVYGIAVIYFWIREDAENKRRLAEREERRRIQNAEWEHQVRTNPTLRLLLVLQRENLHERRQARDAMIALRELMQKSEQERPKINWKEEGF